MAQFEAFVSNNMEQTEKYMEEPAQYGVLIRELREEMQLTQEELAYRSMISVEQLQGIETGEQAEPENLILLAHVLGVYPDALQEGTVIRQSRTGLQEILRQIETELQEIGKQDTYIREFLERCGIDTARFQVREAEEAEKSGEKAETVYVVCDTLDGTYVTDENGRVREWEDREDALAFAERMNLEISEQRLDLKAEEQQEQQPEAGLRERSL